MLSLRRAKVMGRTLAEEGNPGPKPMPPDQNCTGKDCQQDPVPVANDMGVALKVLDKSGACLGAALREVVASGETPGEPNNGYGTVVHGQVIAAPDQFADLIGTTNAHIEDPGALTGHPNILVQVRPGLRSTAFGRYQIIHGSAQGMTDFSASGQDAYANGQLRRRGVMTAARNGDFSGANETDPAENDEILQQVYADLPDNPGMHVLSISIGGNELDVPQDYLIIEAQYMANLASSGMTVLVASGDSGAMSNGVLQTTYPTSDPDVTGVGGTDPCPRTERERDQRVRMVGKRRGH